MGDLEERAMRFAFGAHEGQRRKYTDAPYITHPAAVAELVRGVPHTEPMLAAAWLHDVVEDCGVTLVRIESSFGSHVADLVSQLTDVSKPSDGNRAKRKAKDLEHIRHAAPAAKTVKLADVINNSHNILPYDPDFAKVYLEEKRRLLAVLVDGDATLWAMAARIVAEATGVPVVVQR